MLRKNSKKSVVQAGLLSAFRLMGIQAVFVVLVSLAWSWFSADAMSSSLLGGFISIAPNAYFARRFFASGRSSNPQAVVRAFYKGEILKLCITVVLVFLAIKYLSILILPFLTGFSVAALGLWFAPMLIAREAKEKEAMVL